MAYVSQENKKTLAPQIKAVLKKYKMKASISICNYSTLVVTIQSGVLNFDLPTGSADVNEFWIDKNYEGEQQSFLNELLAAMQGQDFFDHSEPMTDYHHVSHYTDIKIGTYKKDYLLVA